MNVRLKEGKVIFRIKLNELHELKSNKTLQLKLPLPSNDCLMIFNIIKVESNSQTKLVTNAFTWDFFIDEETLLVLDNPSKKGVQCVYTNKGQDVKVSLEVDLKSYKN